jgi:Radical SAM superfamily
MPSSFAIPRLGSRIVLVGSWCSLENHDEVLRSMYHSKLRALIARIEPTAAGWQYHPQEPQLPLELAYIAGQLISEGWHVDIADGWLKPLGSSKQVASLVSSSWDMVLVQIETLNSTTALRVGEALASSGGAPLVIAMGQMASESPERLLRPHGPFHVCIDGEPELTVGELAKAVADRRAYRDIPGLIVPMDTGACRRNASRGLVDPDALPFPAFDRVDIHRYGKLSCHVPVWGPVRWGWLLTSRGCPFGCQFCSPVLRKSHGQAYRTHSVDYVLAMVDNLQHQLGCNALAFEDDVFTYSRDHTIALCHALAERAERIPWTAQTRIDALDRDLIVEMHRAGCVGLCIGIESASVAIRSSEKACRMSTAEIEDIVNVMHETGMHTTLYFMLGFPGETVDDMEETLRLARRLKPLMIQVAFYTPYPGSPAWSALADTAAVDTILGRSHYNSLPFPMSTIDPRKLWAFRQRFYREFYLSPRQLWRYVTQRLPFTLSQGREPVLLLKTLFWLATAKAKSHGGDSRHSSEVTQ